MSTKSEDFSNTEEGKAGHDYREKSDSTTSCLNTPFDLASHLKKLEALSAQMTDDEARLKLLYELSVS